MFRLKISLIGAVSAAASVPMLALHDALARFRGIGPEERAALMLADLVADWPAVLLSRPLLLLPWGLGVLLAMRAGRQHRMAVSRGSNGCP